MLDDYQGGAGESIFATGGKTKEQLYSEAKDILAAMTASPTGFVSSSSASSPGSTMMQQPRRPPRSKHDRDPSSPEPQVRPLLIRNQPLS
jgi:hypothetical protein